jgi:hypothetical protein
MAGQLESRRDHVPAQRLTDDLAAIAAVTWARPSSSISVLRCRRKVFSVMPRLRAMIDWLSASAGTAVALGRDGAAASLPAPYSNGDEIAGQADSGNDR